MVHRLYGDNRCPLIIVLSKEILDKESLRLESSSEEIFKNMWCGYVVRWCGKRGAVGTRLTDAQDLGPHPILTTIQLHLFLWTGGFLTVF